MKAKRFEDAKLLSLRMEAHAIDQRMLVVSSKNLEKARKQVLREPPEGRKTCQHSDFRTLDFQRYKINLCCFRPQSPWHFVPTAETNIDAEF